MQDNTQAQTGLPLPKWCFALLGIATLYPALSYLALVVWAISGMFIGSLADPPQWLAIPLIAALCVTCGTWPAYGAWVIRSKRLTLREKAWWLSFVIALNIVAMPVFYVFMIRRYLGLEGRTNEKDQAALDRFLKRHGIAPDRLSQSQMSVLRSYCRKRRMFKWSGIAMLVVAGLQIYAAVVFLPATTVPFSADLMPTHLVVIDSATDSRKDLPPDPERQKRYVQMVMMIGAMAGAAGALGVLMLGQAIVLLCGGRHQRALIDFLRAYNLAHSTSAST